MTPPTQNDYTLDISDYLDVRARLGQLGCNEPDGLAFLPIEFESAGDAEELRQSLETVTLRKLFIAADIPYADMINREPRIPIVQNNWSELVLPTLLVTAAFAAENPSFVNIALGVISNYVNDHFRGMGGVQTVKMEMICESPAGNYKRVTYEGPPQYIERTVQAFEEITHD